MSNNLFNAGHTACAGCGQSMAARLVIEASGQNTMVVNNTGCLEVFSTAYPQTAWGVPWIHSLFENAAAVASGVEAGLIYSGKKEGANIIAQGGDGSTADIGLQALSGMLERGHDILYVCLPPDTELILGDGSIVEIGEFVDSFVARSSLCTQKLFFDCQKIIQKQASLRLSEEQVVTVSETQARKFKTVEIVPAQGRVLSWDRAQFLPMNVSCAQRKNSDETLIKITTASGRSLRLTGEHPVLIDTINGPKWQRADLLKTRAEVYAPRRIVLDSPEKDFYILDFLGGNIKVKLRLDEKENINQKLKEHYGSIKDASKAIGFKYQQMKEKNRMVDLEGLRKIYRETPCLDWGQVRKSVDEFGVQGGVNIKIKEKTISAELMYLFGLISSDGSLADKSYAVTFINKEDALIEEFKKAYRGLFTGRKISQLKNKDGVTYLVISDPVLSTLAKNLGIKSDPKELIRMPEGLISAFLRGYFDGDGYCGITKGRHSSDAKVILSTVKERIARRLRQMLQRLGIACFQVSREDRFDLIISSMRDIERFLNQVSSEHPVQKARMSQIRGLWKTRQPRGKFFSIAPKACGKILKDICNQENISLTKLDRKRNICALAAGTRRATKARILEYREGLVKIIGSDKNSLFKELDSYLKDDFYLDPIEKVEIVPCVSKFVYDITVENTHLFVPEGAFVISNCYDNEAYENTGVQRSGLTPYGANTTTTPPGTGSVGNVKFKKPMPEIVNAHGIPYVATASAGFPQDLQRKVKKAMSLKGPKYIQVHVPCPLGWRHESAQTVNLAKLAVETGLYPLIEYENGKLIGARQIHPKPVEEYLKAQGRFKHLANNPEETKKIQEVADHNIEKYGLKIKPETT